MNWYKFSYRRATGEVRRVELHGPVSGVLPALPGDVVSGPIFSWVVAQDELDAFRLAKRWIAAGCPQENHEAGIWRMGEQS